MDKKDAAALSFPDRFEVQGRLGEGGMGIVYQVLDRDTRVPMAAKTLRHLSPEHLYWLKNEFRRLADLQHPNLVQLGELYSNARHCFFTMEFVKGIDFRSHVRGKQSRLDQEPEPEDGATDTMSVAGPESYFTRAGDTMDTNALVASTPTHGEGKCDEAKLRSSLIQLAEAIVALHRYGLVHRDLKPSNVMVEPSGRVVVLDFGLAGTLQQTKDGVKEGLYGTAAYMPPEQVELGAVDGASDWYAFGVMIFNALTGRLPFEGPAHHVIKAKQQADAPRVSALLEDCPPDLDELCARLLERDPKARPTGEEVLAILRRGDGSADERESKPRLERVFVGRDQELARLDNAMERVSSGGFASFLLEGEPGVGKTELVEHFVARLGSGPRPLVVLRGRCYEQEHVPFKGIDAVVDSLTRYLKSLRDEHVRRLLPARMNLVAALYPVLYRVSAVADSVPPIDVNENRPEQREEAIRQLGQVLFALARDVRLVVFIDDLQWAAQDSFDLLTALFDVEEPPPLLLLATRRTTDAWGADEQGAEPKTERLTSGLMSLFERMRIAPLNEKESRELLEKLDPSEGCEAEQRRAQLLAEAGGHPLFLQELSRYTARDVELPSELRLDKVLRERIRALDAGARRLLEVAAIAGIPLPARVLARVADITRAESVAALRLLRAEQLIRTDGGADSHSVAPYHDRIRETIVQGLAAGTYEHALATDLPGTHLSLARQLSRVHREDDFYVASTTLANHFNLGSSAIEDPAEHVQAVQANLTAARQVKLASALKSALHYLTAARERLAGAPSAERARYERELDLVEMEVDYLDDDELHGEEVFSRLVSRSHSPMELAAAYEARIMVETARNHLAGAIATAREGLARLGMTMPKKGSDLLLLRDVAAFELRLRGREPTVFLDLPESDDQSVRGQMQILMAMTPAAYFSDPPLMSMAMIRMATLSLKRGLTELSAYGVIGYALVLAAGFQKFERAGRFSRVAVKLNERFENQALDCKIGHLHNFNIGAYVKPFADCKQGLAGAQELGLANGDLNFRTYAAVCTPMVSLCSGDPLSEVQRECLSGVSVSEQEGNVDMAAQTHWRIRMIRCLRGENESPLRMDAVDSSEEEFLRETEESELPTANFAYGLAQALLGVHFDDPERALQGAERALEFGHAQFGLITHIDVALYQTLAACLVLERGCSAKERKRLQRMAKKNLKKLEKWSRSYHENFAGHHLLAAAEVARVSGSASKAKTGLEEALAYAEQHDRHNQAGLCHERLAQIHLAEGDKAAWQEALAQSAAAYRRWEAPACVARVERLGQDG